MPLTKYPSGSVRELWMVSFPLMLSSFSMMAMIFADRLMLTYYSANAMSAAVTAGTAGWAVLGSLLILTSMSEVFVAQYNGAKQYSRIGQPVWQMVYFSFASLILLIPLALWGGQFFFRGSPLAVMEDTYFSWLVGMGFVFPLQAALAAFYVGRGKTKLVMALALGANVANVILDWLLIFGVEGWIPRFGIKGAAMATCFGTTLQAIVLACLIFRKEYGRKFGTWDLRFYPREFIKCVRVGFPQGALFFIELVGWAIFYMMIARLGPEHIFVAGAAQSVIILFLFAAEGVGRGAAAISGNLIGEGNHSSAFAVFRSGLKLHAVFFALASILFVIYPEPFMRLFINDAVMMLQEGGIEVSSLDLEAMVGTLRITLQLSLLYLLFEGIRWLTSGILAAAGDTLFLLLAGLVTVPVCQLLPTYIVVERLHAGVAVAFVVAVGYAAAVSTIFIIRFFGKKWQEIDLLS